MIPFKYEVVFDLKYDVTATLLMWPSEAEAKIRYEYHHVLREDASPVSLVKVVNHLTVLAKYLAGELDTIEIQMEITFPERLGQQSFLGVDISPGAKAFFVFGYEAMSPDEKLIEVADRAAPNGTFVPAPVFRMAWIQQGRKRMRLGDEVLPLVDSPYPIPDSLKPLHETHGPYEVPFLHRDGTHRTIRIRRVIASS